MHLEFRKAVADDAAECVKLRGKTRENAVSVERLASLGISEKSWAEHIKSGELPGHLCVCDGHIAGYCFGSRETGEIVVLALHPDFEAQGIGRKLLGQTIGTLLGFGHTRLFLGCSTDPTSRSYGFYRHLGWRSTAQLDENGDELLELLVPTSST
jgi:GNAT superfamily N-acetyltransferase